MFTLLLDQFSREQVRFTNFLWFCFFVAPDKEMNIKYDKDGLPVSDYYKKENIPVGDKMKAVVNQKYYTAGAIIFMIVVLVCMYLILN